jgi:hypothetical protein
MKYKETKKIQDNKKKGFSRTKLKENIAGRSKQKKNNLREKERS